MSRRQYWWLFVAVSFAFPCSPARAEEYRDANRHFTVQIPDNWGMLAPETLAMANELGKRLKVSYDTGFQPAGQPAGKYPYLLIQCHGGSMGFSYEQIEEALAKGAPAGIRRAEGVLADVVKDLKLGSAIVDRRRNRAILRVELIIPDGRKVQGISYGMFGAEGTVWLHCYAYEEEFDRYLPTYNIMADSFRYDEGFGFVPGQRTTVIPPPTFDLVPGVAFGIVGGVIAAAFVLLRRLLHKRPFDSESLPSDHRPCRPMTERTKPH